MASPAASTDSSTLSPPPSTLSSPSPEPESSSLSSPPPSTPTRGKKSAANGKKKGVVGAKQRKKEKTVPTKITLKLKQPKHKAKEKGQVKEKKMAPKPREPKIERIPRSLVNNYDVPLVVLFRSKFRTLFTGTSELGPQDVEESVSVEGDVSGKLEEFVTRICVLIGNRKKSVEREQLGKVLQETVDSSFERYGYKISGLTKSPMADATFARMDWDARLILLRALVHWALLSSDAVRQMIDDGYKISPTSRVEREELDSTSGLGVQPLFAIKGDRYYLIEGKDTRFRIYHETNPWNKIVNISSVAHDKGSLLEFAGKLDAGSKAEKEFAGVVRETIVARIEAAEHRRVRAEQAALRLAMWAAAPPVYNTRTRGKRVDYSEFGKDTESEDEDRGSRRSERNREREIVEYTASGRMVKRPRFNGLETRESKLRVEDDDESDEEMEWSVYSDKGETGTEDEGDEEGEEEDYDIDGRSLVVKLAVNKERLRDALSGSRAKMNGTPGSPGTLRIAIKPTQPQSSGSTRPYHQQVSPAPPYRASAPRVHPSSILTPPPVLVSVPLPYTGGASPPLPSRPVQLSSQPIPRPFAQSPPQSQAYPPPQLTLHPYQRPRPQPTRTTYAIAHFDPNPQPYPTATLQPSPRPYASASIPSESPPAGGSSAGAPAAQNAGWFPARPFGPAPSNESAQSSGKPPPALTNMPRASMQQTWSAATLEPTPGVNGSSDYVKMDGADRSAKPPVAEMTGTDDGIAMSGKAAVNGTAGVRRGGM